MEARKCVLCLYPGCGYKTVNKGTLKRHERFKHTGESPFICPFCDWSGKCSGDLKTHVSIHHTHEKRFHCKKCDYKTASSSSLTLHNRQHHLKTKPFCCTKCDFKTAASSSLHAHLRSHSGLKPFKCEHCKQSFSHSSTRNLHVQKHELQKNYPITCPLAENGTDFHVPGKTIACSIRTANSVQLEYHILRNHTPEGIGEKFESENKLALFLSNKGVAFDRDWANEIQFKGCKNIEGQKSSARPDFYLPEFSARLNAVVLLGNDEFAHRYYSCDWQRMMNIVSALEQHPDFRGLPLLYFRFNPHHFTVDGKLFNPSLSAAHEVLWQALQSINLSDLQKGNGLYLVYVHYDREGQRLKIYEQQTEQENYSSILKSCILRIY